LIKKCELKIVTTLRGEWTEITTTGKAPELAFGSLLGGAWRQEVKLQEDGVPAWFVNEP
jgi:hypothetical protein